MHEFDGGPLAATIARLRERDSELDTTVGALEDDWFSVTELWDPTRRTLAEGLAISIADYPGADWRAAGAFLMGHYVWYLAAAAVSAYLSERRVPDLTLGNVALRHIVHTHEYEGKSYTYNALAVRLLSGHFAALPDDPAATDPAALILPDATALREWLRLTLERHLAQLIDALYNSTRLSKRAQWNLAADSCARLFQWYGAMLGDEARGCAEGLAFIKAPGSPLAGSSTGFITLEHEGHSATFCVRGGCCLVYRVPGGERCATCVGRPPAERDQLLRSQLTRQHAAQATA